MKKVRPRINVISLHSKGAAETGKINHRSRLRERTDNMETKVIGNGCSCDSDSSRASPAIEDEYSNRSESLRTGSRSQITPFNTEVQTDSRPPIHGHANDTSCPDISDSRYGKETKVRNGREPHLWPQIIGTIPTHGRRRAHSLPASLGSSRVARREAFLYVRRTAAATKRSSCASPELSTGFSPEEPLRRHTLPRYELPIYSQEFSNTRSHPGFIKPPFTISKPDQKGPRESHLEGSSIQGRKTNQACRSSSAHQSLETPVPVPRERTAAENSGISDVRRSKDDQDLSEKTNLYHRQSANTIINRFRATPWFNEFRLRRGSRRAVDTDPCDGSRLMHAPEKESLPVRGSGRSRTSSSSRNDDLDPCTATTSLTASVKYLQWLMKEAISNGVEKYERQRIAQLDKVFSKTSRDTRPVKEDAALDGPGDGPRDSPDGRSHEPPTSVRPAYKHAATFCAPDTPRLAEIVEGYSAHSEGIRARANRSSTQAGGLTKSEVSGPNPTNMSTGPQGTQTGHSTPVEENVADQDGAGRKMHSERGISLRRRSHVSLRNVQGFSLPKSHKRQPIARDWSPSRKTFVAAVACLSTALIGVLLGIYAGLVPSIQYYIIDQSHVAVHGNTGCFIGLALPTFFLWPLPLLHGRKPYIMGSLTLAMPLLFPQAIAVDSPRLTNTASWRTMLIASRTLMGCSLGFASMNFHSILMDLFGASLMSPCPHQEVVDQFDARRHGGGMGVWLGIWTWSWVGSLGIGFLIGAAIIDSNSPTWGFYISIILIATVLLLNVACPETRRSAFRRSVAEVRTGTDISRRLARGEIMMHRVKTGPKWWGEEVYHGVYLSLEMLRQPGFAVLAVYVAWIYAQIVLTIILLGSLASRFYRLRSPYVGLHVACITLGAMLAIPFQKANLFSRSRNLQLNLNRQTLDQKITWSSHLVRRAIFTITLPLAASSYAAVSSGPPLSIAAPTVFALCVGFLSCLAISECNGLIMETFDTSDLSPGMVGRQRDGTGQDAKRTNYSCFPRVTSGFAIIHALAFMLSACATAIGGHMTRNLGQRVASGVVAAILFVLTVMLLLVLVRFKNVTIIPRSKSAEMDRLTKARRKSTKRRASMPYDLRVRMEEDLAWRPAMIGNPISKTRRMNVLELGRMARWADIRRKNKLIDEGAHIKCATLGQGLEALDAALEDHMEELRRSQGLFIMGSGRSKHSDRHHRSDRSSDRTPDADLEFLDFGTPGGHSQHRRFANRSDGIRGQTLTEENEDEHVAGPSGQKRD